MAVSRLTSLVTAALLACFAAAFAPAAASVEPIVGPVPLDGGVVVDAPYSMRVPVTLESAAVIDVRAEGSNVAAAAAAAEAGAAGLFGFVLVDATGAPVAAVLSSPLRTEGVDLGPTTFGRGAEAGQAGQSVVAIIDDSCSRCVVPAGSYDLLVVAAHGDATVRVVVEEAGSPVTIDRETARVSFARSDVYHSGRDSWDHLNDRVDGPSVGFQWMGNSFVCSGCSLPSTLLLHDSLVEDASPAVAAASVEICTGEGPNRSDDCERRPMTASPAGRSVATQHVRSVPPTGRLDSFVDLLGGGLDRRPRIRTGVAVILLPDSGSASSTQQRDVRLVNFDEGEERS